MCTTCRNNRDEKNTLQLTAVYYQLVPLGWQAPVVMPVSSDSITVVWLKSSGALRVGVLYCGHIITYIKICQGQKGA